MWAESASIHHSHWSMSRAPAGSQPGKEARNDLTKSTECTPRRSFRRGDSWTMPGMMRAGNPTKMSGGSRNTRKKNSTEGGTESTQENGTFSVGSVSGQYQGSSLPTRRPNVQDDVPSGTKQKWLLPEPSSCGFNQTHVCEVSTS